MSTTQIPPLRVEHGPYLSGFPDPRMTKLWRSDFCSQRHRYRVRSPAFESQRERGSGYMGGSGACGSNATLPVPLQGPLQLEEWFRRTASSQAAPRTVTFAKTACQDSISTRNMGTLGDAAGRGSIWPPLPSIGASARQERGKFRCTTLPAGPAPLTARSEDTSAPSPAWIGSLPQSPWDSPKSP